MKMLVILLLTLALVTTSVNISSVSAQTGNSQSVVVLQTTSVPMAIGTTRVINNGPGNQLDPHIDGNLITYTNDDLAGSTTVHYFDLTTNTDHLVPGNGADSESEVSAGRIAFTEATPLGSQVVLFDTGSQSRKVLDGYGLSKPTIGGDYVYFEYVQDRDIGGYLISGDFLVRMTNDAVPDTNPIISPGGRLMLYQRCQSPGVGCIFTGFLIIDPGTVPPITVPSCPGASQYDTSDEYVLAYTSNKDGDTDIYVQPIVGTTPETRLLISGEQRNVSISKNLVAFESPVQLGNATEYDIFVYDMNTSKLYQVTNTPVDESLADISVKGDFARLVYSAPSQTSNSDVFAFSFPLPGSTAAQVTDLTSVVASFNLADGTANSLNTKLQDALNALTASDTATACLSLTSFINAARAQSGKKLTPAQANQLINYATTIKVNIGC